MTKTWKEILLNSLDGSLVAIKIDDVLYTEESLDEGLALIDKCNSMCSYIDFIVWDKQSVYFIVNDSDYGEYLVSAPRNP